MRGQADQQRCGGDLWMVERAIVLQVLRDDHEERWGRAELAREIPDFEPAVLEEGLTELERDGVLRREEHAVFASRAARRLDELELISI
jgi:DNA-binding HxlR family transcriptional regulator